MAPAHHSHPRPPRARARTTVASAAAFSVALAGLVSAVGTGTAVAVDRTATLAGTFQSENGCPGDWQPDCTATLLTPTGTEGVYEGVFPVPAGSHAFKVAMNGSWEEAYGVDGEDITFTVAGDAELRFVFDDTTKRTTVTPTNLGGAYDPATDDAIIAEPVRQPGSDERFYFVMTDRFANGDPGNDTAGIEGDRLAHGFDPTDRGFYNGGDLRGLIDNLDYIQGLGTTAIWLTPSFKNRPVQGVGENASAGYHGYWITDFTQIDPHLGTNAELEQLITEAEARGIDLFFDIITNHTADVISYEEGQYSYIPQDTTPYVAADGTTFRMEDVAGLPAAEFPELTTESFPYTPVVDPADAEVKVPALFNDVRYYHNRGDSTWAGESETLGDFVGLDDIMTEHPDVVDAFVEVYKDWIDLGVDGFRIDTAKHVNFEFWELWTPEIVEHARTVRGDDEFFMFGEVYSSDTRILSPYVRDTEMSSVLDFAFQERAAAYVTGSSSAQLRDLYASDDIYTTPDTSATALPTFLGNHDMGRIGYFVRGTDAPLERSKLAHSLMYLTRGQPVVYYGDEQGFIGRGAGGEGNDKAARQSLFASQVPEYQNQVLLDGTTAGSVDRYDTDTALYSHIAALSELREQYPALSRGAQIELLADGGLYAFARVDRAEGVEHLVVTNNGGAEATATFATLTPGATYTGIFGTDQTVTADAEGTVSVTVPARGAVALVADETVAAAGDVDVEVTAGRDGAGVWGQAPITAAVADNRYQETTFAYRVVGDEEWTLLGTAEDDTPRVFHDVEGLIAEHGLGTLVEYRAVTVDAAGNASAASTLSTLVEEPVDGPPPSDFDTVSVPGSHNDEMGCGGDWAPACAEAQLTLGANGLWSKTFALPAGDYEFKVAANESWDLNWGSNGQQDGPNLAYSHAGGPITFWFDPVTKYYWNSALHAPITIPGSHNSELGCADDWQPQCTRTLMTDLDRDGVFTFVTDAIPAGSYEAKVALGFSWDVNYGADGAPGGANIPFSVGNDGDTIEFTFDLESKVLTIGGPTVGIGGRGQSAAHWLSEDVLALPVATLGGRDLADLTFVLHTAAEGGITLDGTTPVLPEGAQAFELVAEGTGLPEDLAELFPHLAGHVVLRLQDADRADVEAALTGQLVVSATDGDDALAVFTGVQIPGVVDALFAQDAAERQLGVTWDQRKRPTVALWAPTAKDVDLLVWPDGRALDGEPVRVAMDRQSDGTWTAAGEKRWRNGAAYQFDVTVYVPSTGAVETNRVTDPYSVALTLNSTHSVFLDLDDRRWMPGRWRNADQPVVRPVDQTIYELHVRDFSINDETVPEELRGTYAAFTTEGAGRQHLRALQEAGLTTVHLLPTFDIATIEEDRSAQAEPPCDLASFPPDSPEQQACINEIRDADGFNWGYDPFHFTTPEGSYAVDAHGGARVEEFRSMVGALHSDGLQVVLDQVFNHTAASGQDAKSVLDRVVPGYYHRLNAAGNVETSTCCQNIATEHQMAEKLMVDSVVTWARDYKVDGFRFDLMGHHSRDNMLAVREALDALTPDKDGVDGSAVYLYGEGWNFGEVADDARFEQARQGNLGGTGIGTFSDRLRDAVRGGGPFDSDPRVRQGFGTGAYTDRNGLDTRSDADLLADARHQADLVRLGLAGNLRDFEFVTSAGEVQRGDEIDYNGQPAGYADSPEEIITYVDKHDNETLFDILTLKLPTDTPMADRVRMNTVSLATTALSQTPAFFHAGSDLLRSKSLDRNSYNSGDWFNLLDFTGQDNGFARGLPQAGDNQEKWPTLAPLLADPALKPAPEDIATASQAYQDLLELRFSTELFRLGDPELIQQKVTFPGSGADAAPGVIAMHVDDTVGTDVDGSLDGLLTVFNASDEAVTMTVADLVGDDYVLSPVLAGGSDEVVKATTWDAATGTVTVPARTVAVLVDREQPVPPPAPVHPGKGHGKPKGPAAR